MKSIRLLKEQLLPHAPPKLTGNEHSTRQQDGTDQSWREGEGAVSQVLEETDTSTCATKFDFLGCITDAESNISRTRSERNTFTGEKDFVTSDKLCSQANTFRTKESACVTPRSTIQKRNTQDSNFSDSGTKDKLCARKQKRKKKHQAKKDAAAKKRGRFSATDNVATEDALGVEEMESVPQIARHLPKPSRSK